MCLVFVINACVNFYPTSYIDCILYIPNFTMDNGHKVPLNLGISLLLSVEFKMVIAYYLIDISNLTFDVSMLMI